MGVVDELEERAPELRRPICADCMGQGKTNQPRAGMIRDANGRPGMTTVWTPARCQACRGTGFAGA